MSDPVLDAYVAGLDAESAPAATALDAAVMQAWPELVKKISYGMLMYALSGDFRHWVCAIDAHKKPFRLRFLYGTLLEDPARRLRSGTSHLSNLDFPSLEDIDVMLVASYVREAASRHDEFKAQLGEA